MNGTMSQKIRATPWLGLAMFCVIYLPLRVEAVDCVPVMSQCKSIVQACCFDLQAAKETQDNFSKLCPMVSQCRSLYHLFDGDREQALEVQREFGRTVQGMAEACPVIGHVIGICYYCCGWKEDSIRVIKDSSRMIGLTLAGIGWSVGSAFYGLSLSPLVVGPIAGVAYDGTVYGMDVACNGQRAGELRGTVGLVLKTYERPSSGAVFDLLCGVAGDAWITEKTSKVVDVKRKSIKDSLSESFSDIELPEPEVPDLPQSSAGQPSPIVTPADTAKLGVKIAVDHDSARAKKNWRKLRAAVALGGGKLKKLNQC